MGGGVHAKILAGGIVALGIATGCSGAAEGTTTSGVVPSADGVSIAYETAGESPLALVFVHGWSCDRSYWSAQVEAFSPEFRVVAMDLAVHGESGGGRDVQSMTAFGADVAAVVDHLGIERTLLIGHSMGGDVIMEAARLLPGRVLGLVWMDTYRQLPVRRTPEELEAILAPFRADFVGTTREAIRGLFPEDADSSLVERVAADMSSAPPSIAIPPLEAVLRYAHEIPAVSCATWTCPWWRSTPVTGRPMRDR